MDLKAETDLGSPAGEGRGRLLVQVLGGVPRPDRDPALRQLKAASSYELTDTKQQSESK